VAALNITNETKRESFEQLAKLLEIFLLLGNTLLINRENGFASIKLPSESSINADELN